MIYRGLKIELKKPEPARESQWSLENGQLAYHDSSYYAIFETIAGFHWEEIGAVDGFDEAVAMIDRIADVRDALEKAQTGPPERAKDQSMPTYC